MTNLSSSLAAMTVDRNTWQSRAGTAWGASGTWNLGSSYQTDLTAMTADRNTWQSRAAQAYDGGAWGSGNLWSADAHNDPGVWTNRYNAGYSQATTDKQPPAAAVVLATSFGGSLTGSYADRAVLTTDRAGYWITMANINVTPSVNADMFMRMRFGGTTGLAGLYRLRGGASSQSGWSSMYDGPAVLLAAGTQVAFQTQGGDGGINGDFRASFVPVQAYPH
jgi:hypothetical protein